MEKNYELKLAGGERVIWPGSTPQDAARRYLDTHRGETVIAWRETERFGVFPGVSAQQIIG